MTRIEILKAKLKEKQESTEYLKELFEGALFFIPPTQQFHTWLSRFDVELIAAAIERTGEWYIVQTQNLETAVKAGKMTQATADKVAKTQGEICSYASGVMKGMLARAESPVPEAPASTSFDGEEEGDELA
jgi:hypothetical protein